jgi:hypothetical protein
MKDNKNQSCLEKNEIELQGKPLPEKQTDIAVIGVACRFTQPGLYKKLTTTLSTERLL